MKKPEEKKGPKTTKTTKQLGVQVDVGLWKRFRKLALDEDVTATELLREAMEEYLLKHGAGDR